MAVAAVTEATEAMEPTEMSSMPATMTTVSPRARRPTMTIDWLRLFMRFCQDRNSGCSQMTMTTMRMSARTSDRLSTPTTFTTRFSRPTCWSAAVRGSLRGVPPGPARAATRPAVSRS